MIYSPSEKLQTAMITGQIVKAKVEDNDLQEGLLYFAFAFCLSPSLI
jgi:hypothetical protein